MCGIGALLGFSEEIAASLGVLLESAILPRGPDASNSLHLPATSFFASVLSLRGKVVSQPVRSERGDILLWNGEIFGGIEVGNEDNDTEVLMRLLCAEPADALRVPKTLSKILGEFAVIFWDNVEKKLWIGRDPLGRRSLLYAHLADGGASSSPPALALSSCAFGTKELGLCPVDIKAPFWGDSGSTEDQGDEGDSTPDSRTKKRSTAFSTAAAAVSPPPPPVWNELPPHGILCFDFGEEGVIGRCTLDRAQFYPWSEFSPVEQRISPLPPRQMLAAEGSGFEDSVGTLLAVLDEATKRRTSDIFVPEERKKALPSSAASLGLLFSGGIDSMILAALAHRHVGPEETIDLMNVAFGDSPNTCADRKAAISGLEELKAIAPDRKWNLVLVDVRKDELEMCKPVIAKLIAPRSTVLDLNIGASLWFAARGIGRVHCGGETTASDESAPLYTSPARVLLSGLGSDEQLGGYGRHRTAFQRGGWECLHSEMELDMGRLWIRNLGRDDRLISFHGRECRWPFLDEHFILCLRRLPLCHLTDPTKAQGVGDKQILREAARRLGLTDSTRLIKRAIQFGSKISKISFPELQGSSQLPLDYL